MFEQTDSRSKTQQPGQERRGRPNRQAIATPRSRHRRWSVGLLTTLLTAGTVIGAAPAKAATTIETMPLWRLQVRITTATNLGDGTDGHPAIRFNPSSTGVRTLNPQSTAAFDRGHVDTYDLRLLDSAKQITMLRLGIASDRWCIKKVELLFNNRIAFADEPGQRGCVQPGTNLDYNSSQLRHNSKWLNYGTPPALPHGLSATNLRALVSSVTGSAMLATPDYWWNRAVPVSITRTNSSTLRVSFGILVFDGVVDTREETVTYDVRLFRGSDGRLHAKTASPAGPNDGTMVDAVVAQLNKSLSRMTARPQPPNPLRFGIDAFTNITWSYTPVIG
jgi:hypothetical protein